MASVGIAIVNYKTYELTRLCLELLREPCLRAGYEVWVVDNDSQDESTTYLRSQSWIHLIERPRPEGGERGFMAHGLALDRILAESQVEKLFLLHTDTLIYNPDIFRQLLATMEKRPDILAIGCLEQLDRGRLRTAWRLGTRYTRYRIRSFLKRVGIPARDPHPYKEKYIKSFCALWNTQLMRTHGWTFAMKEQTPSYAMQDICHQFGYKILHIAPSKIFRYLDHVEAGTVAAAGSYGSDHRRTQRYQALLKKHLDEQPG